MSIRTTVTLEEDVFERLKQASMASGVSVKEMLNRAIRSGLTSMAVRPAASAYSIKPESMGRPAVASLDNIGEVIAMVEGEGWR